MVLEQAKSVNKQLGHQDREKFTEYLESIRSLEQKIELEKPWLDRAKPATDLEEPRPARATADEMKVMMELIALAPSEVTLAA